LRGLIKSFFNIWAILSWPATFDDLFHNALKGSNAHPSLTVSSQCIMAGKAIATKTRIRLNTTVDLCVTFKIMLADEAFLAVWTLILAITKMCLHMRLNVFLASKTLLALWKQTSPFLIGGIRAFDVTSDIINGNASVCDGFRKIDVI
jgi:hypothetical protein